MAYFTGPEMLPGDYGIQSSFDIVPTIFSLLGEQVPVSLSGSTLLGREPTGKQIAETG
jgi:hypothetical protein